MKIGINGMGRMGRLALRAALGGIRRASDDPRRDQRLDVVHVNEVKGGAAVAAHLLEFDSIHGRWHETFQVDGERGFTVGGRYLGFSAGAAPDEVPWGDLGCELVLECTGKFLKPEQLEGYFRKGVKRVIVAAPVKDDRALNVVVGVNDHLYDPDRHRILTAASCTTNCLAPVVKPLHDRIGLLNGLMTTIHAYTNDQVLTDVYHEDLRRARSATMSMIPTKTGAAAAVGLVLPELNGRLDGYAMRVPTINVSVVDLSFVAARDTTVAEVNAIMKEAAEGALKGVLAYTEEQLVSVDFNHNPASSTFDATLTKVSGRLVKVSSWYDNEWGFSNRMLDTTVALMNAR